MKQPETTQDFINFLINQTETGKLKWHTSLDNFDFDYFTHIDNTTLRIENDGNLYGHSTFLAQSPELYSVINAKYRKIIIENIHRKFDASNHS